MPMPNRVLPPQEAQAWSMLNPVEQANFMVHVNLGYTVHGSNDNGSVWLERPPNNFTVERTIRIRAPHSHPLATATRQLRVENGMEIIRDWGREVSLHDLREPGVQVQARATTTGIEHRVVRPYQEDVARRQWRGTDSREWFTQGPRPIADTYQMHPDRSLNPDSFRGLRAYAEMQPQDNIYQEAARSLTERLNGVVNQSMLQGFYSAGPNAIGSLSGMQQASQMNTTAPRPEPTPGERAKAAEDWLKSALKVASVNPLGADGGFLNWSMGVYAEYMRKRDGEV